MILFCYQIVGTAARCGESTFNYVKEEIGMVIDWVQSRVPFLSKEGMCTATYVTSVLMYLLSYDMYIFNCQSVLSRFANNRSDMLRSLRCY